MGNKRVGIEFSEDVWKEARKRCIDLDVSFSTYVRKLVMEDLEKQKKNECA